MLGYRQYFFRCILGPFVTIGSILQQQQWAHMKPQAAFLRRNSGPTQGYWQHHFRESLGPFMTNSNILQQPQWAHMRPSVALLGETVGLFVTISRIFWQQQWSHSNLSPAFGSNSEPIQSNGLLISGAIVGPFKSIVTKFR